MVASFRLAINSMTKRSAYSDSPTTQPATQVLLIYYYCTLITTTPLYKDIYLFGYQVTLCPLSEHHYILSMKRIDRVAFTRYFRMQGAGTFYMTLRYVFSGMYHLRMLHPYE